MRVFNKHRGAVPPKAVYVGRPSKWGNPHPIGFQCPLCRIEHDRAGAITAYEQDLTERLKDMMRKELRGKDLVCFCAPLACHADIILRIANTCPSCGGQNNKHASMCAEAEVP